VVAGVVGGLLLAGVLMVPLLGNYRLAGVASHGGRALRRASSRARSPPIR
jgi:hypothetical protein